MESISKEKDGQLYLKLDHDLECITLCTCHTLPIVKLDLEQSAEA